MSQTDEFDVEASRTVDAILRLGPDHALPGACRGSGGPGALDWLATWVVEGGVEPVLDVGAGLGGPSAWLRQQRGVRSVMLDPMEGAIQGARRLFGFPGVVAAAEALPVRDACFAAAWCLGVLSTVTDVPAVLNELVRVVEPGGRVGMVVYVTLDQILHDPSGSHFESWIGLSRLLDGAGLDVVATARLDDLPSAGERWDDLHRSVEREVDQRHGADPAQRSARADRDRVEHLIEEGRVVGLAVRASRRAG